MELIGIVKWFDSVKGFGVIGTPSEEHFLHINAFKTKPSEIDAGLLLIFESKIDRIRKRSSAINPRFIQGIDDFEIVIQYFNSPDDTVTLESGYRGKQKRHLSITNNAICKLADKVSKAALAEKLKVHFNGKLNRNNVIDCIRLCKMALTNSLVSTPNEEIKQVFRHLGTQVDDETMFEIWRGTQYKLFVSTENSDELPFRILRTIKSPLTSSDISKIKKYSYWEEFFKHFIEQTSKSILESSTVSFNEHYSLLSSFSIGECDQFKKEIEPAIVSRIQQEVNRVLIQLDQLKTEADLVRLQEITKLVPYQLGEPAKTNLKNWIGLTVLKSVDPTLLGPLWMKNIIDPFPEEEIPLIIATWSSTDRKAILAALHRIKRNEKVRLVESNLYSIIKSIDWTGDEAWQIYDANPSLGIELLQCSFSFVGNSVISRLESLLENPEAAQLIEQLKTRFKSQLNFLEADIIIAIYSLTQFNPFDSIDELLDALVEKIIRYSDYQDLLELNPEGFDYNLMAVITQSTLAEESFATRLECFEQVQTSIDLARPILEILFVGVTEETKSRCHKDVLDVFTETTSEELCKVYLDLYGREVMSFHPNLVFALAVKYSDRLISARAYSLLLFLNVKELVNFIKTFGKTVLESTYTGRNPGLTSCLRYFINNDPFSDEAFGFISRCKGGMQTFIVKSFVYKVGFKKMDREILDENLRRYPWTEISVVVIHSFLKSSTQGEKVILSTLQQAVREHFEILNRVASSQHTKEFIKENFAIGNILSKCDGRKFFNVTRPTTGNAKRYYEGALNISFRDSMDCFCEGVPWKKETFYNSKSDESSERELYWCRGNICAARNDSFDPKSGYDRWTITEIAKVLNITIEKVALAKMAGWANKMNNIVDRLFCRSCNNFLRPILNYSKYLGISPIPLFTCHNSQCQEHQKPIRFTHCLNGKCETHWKSLPLDSRDCEHCHTDDGYNWGLTCNRCGTPCPKCQKKTTHVIAEEVW